MNQFLKYFFYTIFLIVLFSQLYAQRRRVNHVRLDEKYFISIAYGVGSASWNSELNQSAIYDTAGAKIFSGNVLFNAKNTLNNLTLDVGAQVVNIRLGLGIAFEEFFLEKININGSNYAFSDQFTFSKLFAHTEIPLNKVSGRSFSCSIKSSVGFYTSYYLNHYNLFGSGNGGTSLFLNTGFLADYKFFPHTYFFLQPVIEYKYFQNSRKEYPSSINHQIWNYFLMIGCRIDVSKD